MRGFMVKVFVSYNHAQRDWVRDRLEPCLKAGGAGVLIDSRNFVAGPALMGQMDATQDKADRQILVLSEQYLSSPMCLHEMERAISVDPTFARQIVIPVRRDDAPLPDGIKHPNPLFVDLRDDSDADQWEHLLGACDATLGATAPDWIAARDEALRLLERDQSVNLVIKGSVRWQGLINDLAARPALKLARVDLQDPATVPRRGLIEAMLGALGVHCVVLPPPEDLPQLGQMLATLGRSRMALYHFDLVRYRPDYDPNLFAALRYIVVNQRRNVTRDQRPMVTHTNG